MDLFKSTVGRKILMAVTGLCLIGFITVHLLGNLSVFAGPDGINAYAEHLHARMSCYFLLVFHWPTCMRMGNFSDLPVLMSDSEFLEFYTLPISPLVWVLA